MAKQAPKLDKFAIAAALQEIAALLELKGGRTSSRRVLIRWRTFNVGLSADLGDLVTRIDLPLSPYRKRTRLTDQTALSHRRVVCAKSPREEFLPASLNCREYLDSLSRRSSSFTRAWALLQLMN